MSRQNALMLIAAVLLVVGLEFSVASPWHNSIRSSIATSIDITSRGVMQVLWKHPCNTAEWQYVDLDGAFVPLPQCFEHIVTPPLIKDGFSTIVAFDTRSRDTFLLVSAMPYPPERAARVRAVVRARKNCSVSRDDELFVYTCLSSDGTTVISEDQYFSVGMTLPEYLTETQRRSVLEIADQVLEEYFRMESDNERVETS